MLELPIGIQEVTNKFATGIILNASLANEVKMSWFMYSRLWVWGDSTLLKHFKSEKQFSAECS